MGDRPQLPPHMIAGADQELAACSHSLDELLADWRNAQSDYDRAGLDHLERVAVFVVHHTRFTPYPAVVLAVAVERLARHG
jgi:hypothetical protein